VLYETDGARHDPDRAFEQRLRELSIPTPAERFAREIIAGVLENRARIDTIISTYAPAWPIDQMAVVDRNILRVAIFEMVIGKETPPKVAINEAVEVGKVFGSDVSPKFVNGVLGAVFGSLSAVEES
jgi:N utilization substance protein B